MTNLVISDLRPTGSDLNVNSEDYLNELDDSELNAITGGIDLGPIAEPLGKAVGVIQGGVGGAAIGFAAGGPGGAAIGAGIGGAAGAELGGLGGRLIGKGLSKIHHHNKGILKYL